MCMLASSKHTSLLLIRLKIRPKYFNSIVPNCKINNEMSSLIFWFPESNKKDCLHFNEFILTFSEGDTKTYVASYGSRLTNINSVSFRIFTHLATQQSARCTDSKSTCLSPTLTTWSYGSRLLSWLPSPTYFEILWSLQQSDIFVPFYINIVVRYTGI